MRTSRLTSSFLINFRGKRDLKGARNVSGKVAEKSGFAERMPIFFISARCTCPRFLVQVAQVGAHACVCREERESAARALHSRPFLRVLCNRNRGASRAAVAVERKGRTGEGEARHFSDTPGLRTPSAMHHDASRCISLEISLSLFATPCFATETERRKTPRSL